MNLLQSIFGVGEARGRYPDSLIDKAIERTVDGTDPRLRLVPGYRRRLREPIIRAIDHVVALVDGMVDPVPADKGHYAVEPRLGALFDSAPAMLELLARDRELTRFLSSRDGLLADRVTCLLLAERTERTVLGMELAGDQVRREVSQAAVSFAGHRLVEPAADVAEMSRQLKRRAFDHLLTLALGRIAERRAERSDLKRQRDLLRRKLADLKHGRWSFDADGGKPLNPEALEANLARIGQQLAALGADQDVLKTHLGIVAGVLENASRQLWSETVTIDLDAMNIRRDAADPSARSIRLRELHNVLGRRMSMLPLAIVPGDLPPREDLLTATRRYF